MLDIAQNIRNASLGKSHIFFLGQAGFVFKNEMGRLLGVDLYLSDCVSRYDGFKRLLPFTIQPGEIEFDYLITTHAHYDHFDPDSIPELLFNKRTQLFASENCSKEIERLQCSSERIVYVQRGYKIELDGFKLEFVFCDHGQSAPDAVGVVIDINGRYVYITGDTCLRLDMTDRIKRERKFDILIAPVNGTFGNMDESDVLELCRVLKPELLIPCHFGCFAEQWGSLGALSEKISLNMPQQKYNLMRVGEFISI